MRLGQRREPERFVSVPTPRFTALDQVPLAWQAAHAASLLALNRELRRVWRRMVTRSREEVILDLVCETEETQRRFAAEWQELEERMTMQVRDVVRLSRELRERDRTRGEIILREREEMSADRR